MRVPGGGRSPSSGGSFPGVKRLPEETPGGRFSDQGAVLIYVLWILAALSFLAVQAAGSSRLRALESRWAWEELQRREAVRGWVRLSVFSQAKAVVLPSGRWVPSRTGDLSFWVRRDEERGKTSVNQSDAMRLRRAVEKAVGPGTEPAVVDRVVDALMDWRDPDVLVRPSGAEKEAYERLGLPLPADGPFSSLCELRLVLGVTPAVFWGNPLEDAERQWALESKGLREPEEGEEAARRVGLAESLTVVGGNAVRLTFLFPRGRQGYDIEVLVFSPTESAWSILDRCRGHVIGPRTERLGLFFQAPRRISLSSGRDGLCAGGFGEARRT